MPVNPPAASLASPGTLQGYHQTITRVITMQPTTPLTDIPSVELVPIPGGTFMMGSSDKGPQHEVTLAPFSMGKYPVTQAQYQAIMGDNPSYFNFKGDNRPVERVSWFDAMEFCARLSAHTGQIYTLPSEAQWEYACRAGTTTPFHFGETLTTDLANYNGSDSELRGFYWKKTTEVGDFLPNAFGFYDMHGNVFEWCLDHWHDSYNGAPNDGSAWVDAEAEKNKDRILRGGSWIHLPWHCRCDYRHFDFPDIRAFSIGFRVVSVAQP